MPTIGAGARGDTPAQAPVASLEHGAKRLRELGWEWPTYPDRTTLRRVSLYLMAVPVVVLCAVVGLSMPVDGPIFPCLALTVVLFWLVLAYFTFQLRRFIRLTQGMARRPVNPDSVEHLLEQLKMVGAPFGGLSQKASALVGSSPIAFGLLDRSHLEYGLPHLGASVIIGLNGNDPASGRPYILFVGPVTEQNVGGIVRLAEALNLCPAVKSERPRP